MMATRVASKCFFSLARFFCHHIIAVVAAVAAIAPRRQVVATKAEHRLCKGSVVGELILIAFRREKEPMIYEGLSPWAIAQHKSAVIDVVFMVRQQ